MSLILAALLATLPLVVRTYDTAGLSARALDHAQRSAGTTLAAVGIEPIWRPCHASLCPAAPRPHDRALAPAREVLVRIVNAPPQSAPDTLGFAAVDVDQRAGTLATVYADRVEAMASAAGVDRGELLGRAIAHEIGHLLLGTARHAAGGLMRSTWTPAELRRAWPLDWAFSAGERDAMRDRLVRE